LNCIASSKTLPVSGGKVRILSGVAEVGDLYTSCPNKLKENKQAIEISRSLITSNIENHYLMDRTRLVISSIFKKLPDPHDSN
jgi:hypothetical protein